MLTLTVSELSGHRYLRWKVLRRLNNEYSINRNYYQINIQTVDVAEVGVTCYLKRLNQNKD